MSTVTFRYKNHNGKESVRTVDVKSIDFMFTVNFGYQPGWFLHGFCHDKKAPRSFRLSNIVFDDFGTQSPIPPAYRILL